MVYADNLYHPLITIMSGRIVSAPPNFGPPVIGLGVPGSCSGFHLVPRLCSGSVGPNCVSLEYHLTVRFTAIW